MNITNFYKNKFKINILVRIIDTIYLNAPKLIQIFEAILNLNLQFFFHSLNNKFSKIYQNNFWECAESVSGIGSTLKQTEIIRKEIPILLNEMNFKSLLDMPCGDFNWLNKIELNVDKYIGGDIVPELIIQNKKKYENNIRTFKVLDITRSRLPKVDVILCRDCLDHLSYKDIFKALKNFKNSNSKYILSTTYTNRSKNRNIFSGGWRPLNLQLPPFNFPKALKIINEKCTQANGKISDKSLGLWMFEDISIEKGRKKYFS